MRVRAAARVKEERTQLPYLGLGRLVRSIASLQARVTTSEQSRERSRKRTYAEISGSERIVDPRPAKFMKFNM